MISVDGEGLPSVSEPRPLLLMLLSAFSLDFLGFGVYTFPAGAAGALIRTSLMII